MGFNIKTLFDLRYEIEEDVTENQEVADNGDEENS